jgi:GNAT superfamily N-acetyltransferase
MQPQITPLDPADEPTIDAVLDLLAAAQRVDLPDHPPPCPYAFRAELTFPRTSKRFERSVARVDGEVAGLLSVTLQLKDNLENADAGITVHPAHRRRGVGRALHAYLLDRLRELGRARYSGMTVEPLADGQSAGAGFAIAMGAAVALEEVGRRLDLRGLDESGLDELAEKAGAKAGGYRLVSWRDRVPEEYAADTGYLYARLISDAPMGDLQWEVPQLDVDRFREAEEANVAARMRMYSTGAVHEQSGRLVAITTIAVYHSSPWHAEQWITLVEPGHRGHRLGALVKVENLRYARAQEPAVKVIDTTNASVNSYMIAINEAMGFRPVDRWVHWQRES